MSMSKFEIAIVSLVVGLLIGWVVGYFCDSRQKEIDLPHFIPPNGDDHIE